MKQLEEEYINRKCSIALSQNERYMDLSNKSINIFNRLKCVLGNNKELLFEYEEVLSEIQGIVEVEAYKIGNNN
ncbi:MAG: hypothetical protein N4A63_14085 [Vallitalea sp.]|uniref:hypothetical protein n=1 Tax=Vallitalea sp. TaxID=1882829 RepID=UPI0025F582CB|nr:hypothetical protein [Vallitalea sp.]MCT4544661.1 hypothetical protein [Vallitalea sp.]MCT4686836.1 hypothetical protein [Vallitalea sp.]